MARFVVHRHATGRPHFDLRLIQDDQVRSWSLLKEPPLKIGESRLAVEREELTPGILERPKIEEEAFGLGRIRIWDEGEAEIVLNQAVRLIIRFSGAKLSGQYDLKRMRWYPGNRWLLKKSEGPPVKMS
jgi:DNA ligase D-like protein (predicted 3'-phosphoesterase)